MKKRSRKKIQPVFWFFILLVVGLFAACGKQKSASFLIVNNTDYSIYQLNFSGAVHGEALGIAAQENSEIIALSFDRKVRFSPKLICLSIDDFEGSSSFDVIQNRPCVPFTKKDLDQDLNILVITSEQKGDSIVFDVHLN